MKPRAAITLGTAVLALTACDLDPPRPDYVPERRSGGVGAEGFCDRNAEGLVVRQRNISNVQATENSTTIVRFSTRSGSITENFSVGPLAPGQPHVETSVPIPSACFSPDCSFEIIVDALNDVDESHGDGPDNHEANNSAQGLCIG